ncbi:MAG: hypothetical protein R2824_18285 [Saprospiraceae bacterium]|nr:hypothetical protein [Lewinella sp.]
MSRILLACFMIGLAFSLNSCLEDKCQATRQYTVYKPIYAKMEEYRNAVQPEGAHTLGNTGALYIYQNYIFINELREGIHIIDNTDPSNPTPIAFLNIPGNSNLAVRNNLLYADNYVDLVVMDISDPLNVKYVGRTENVFDSYPFYEDLGYLVYYEESEETVELSCSDLNYGRDIFWFQDDFIAVDVAFGAPEVLSSQAGFDSANSSDGSNIGQSGSLARFSIIDKYLYSVSEYDLRVFDLKDPVNAELASTINIGWGIETIFPYKDNLFIGANNGMYIYDNSDPLNPTQLSLFQHATACDPVFVDGETAYVTLRDGQECQSFSNQLDVVDISDLSAPQLLATHPMQHPHGLSVSNDRLYLCEGDFGFKVFDVSDYHTIGEHQLAQVDDFSAYDVITISPRNLAIVIGKDGLYQFDITDPASPQRLSLLPTGRE